MNAFVLALRNAKEAIKARPGLFALVILADVVMITIVAGILALALT